MLTGNVFFCDFYIFFFILLQAYGCIFKVDNVRKKSDQIAKFQNVTKLKLINRTTHTHAD